MKGNLKIFMAILVMMVMNQTSFGQGFNFDLQGHRGARGLAPENSIPGFLKALEYPITTMELDLVITKDRKVVVSHEPWLNPAICLDPDGNRIESAKQKEFNIFEMDYATLEQCDCGSIGNPGFPEQTAEFANKPLLSRVFEILERRVAEQGRTPLYYNIEIKSTVEDEKVGFQPSVEEFAALVFAEFEKSGIEPERLLMQSFDFRVLRHWRANYSKYPTAALVSNAKSWEDNIKDLGYTPEVYSPYYKLLNAENVIAIKKAGMKLVPWTVNTVAEMQQLLEWGVDGIITDYPDRGSTLLKK